MQNNQASGKGADIIELPRSIAAIAAQHLEKEIIEGRLRPGERLIEEVWAAKFRISRGSFRDVLRILEAANLVEIIPRRGAQVVTLNRRDVEEIYLLRKTLFKFGFSYAAPRMTDQSVDRLRAIYADMATAVAEDDPVEFSRLSEVFDETVFDVADVTRLRAVIAFLGKQTVRYRYIGFKLPGQTQRSLEAHRKIVEAFASRDGKAAGQAVYDVIERAGKTILSLAFDGPDEAPDSTGSMTQRLPSS